MNTKQIGQISESKFVFECAKIGITVSQPIGDNAPYDFIAEKDGLLIKIQCKTLRKLKEGVYHFECRSRVGHRLRQRSTNYTGKIDYFFAYNSEDDLYVMVPISETGRTGKQIRLSPTDNNQSKGVSFIKDYQEWFD